MTSDRQLVGNHISGRMLKFTSMSWRDGRSLLAGKPPCSLNPWSQVSILSYWFDIILLKICGALFPKDGGCPNAHIITCRSSFPSQLLPCDGGLPAISSCILQ